MLVTNGYSDTVVREAQWVQEDLGKIGIKATIDMQDYVTYITKSWPTKDYAIGAGLQTPWLTADDMLISQWYSKGTRNWFNINDTKLDQMILDSRKIADPAKRADALKETQKYIISNSPTRCRCTSTRRSCCTAGTCTASIRSPSTARGTSSTCGWTRTPLAGLRPDPIRCRPLAPSRGGAAFA